MRGAYICVCGGEILKYSLENDFFYRQEPVYKRYKFSCFRFLCKLMFYAVGTLLKLLCYSVRLRKQ
jgi:hypothetical protein